MKNVFIVNPTSGKNRALRVALNIEKYCIAKVKEDPTFEYIIHYTAHIQDATNITRVYKHDKCIIYSVGGDGTLNEVLNGIVGTNNILGVVPAGTGNDFYKTLVKIEEEFPLIDVGKMNDRYFINIANIGIDAEIANNVSLMKKRKIPRKFIYSSSILYTLFKFKARVLEFVLNKTKKKDNYMIIAICNGEYYGGGYMIAPGAIINDGVFDICFCDEIPIPNLLPLISKLKKGKHESSPHFHRRKSDKIIIKANENIICSVDGEIIVADKFDVKIIKNAVTIYNNKELINKFLDI